jgi:hypothetical protein
MRSFRPRESSAVAVAGLLVVNAVPLVGVVAFGWSLHALLVIYWVESGVVGALNVPKILLAAGSGTPAGVSAAVGGRDVDLSGPTEAVDGPHLYVENVPIAGFFLAHYGIFWVVHGVFVLLFPGFAPGAGVGGFSLGAVLVGAVGMVVSHAGSFLVNFVGRGEFRAVSPGAQMVEPYRRVVVLHLTVLFGAFGIAALGVPLVALTLLVGLKTVTDLYAHLREHRRAADRRRKQERERARESTSDPGEGSGDTEWDAW